MGVVITKGATGIVDHKKGIPDPGTDAAKVITSRPIKFGEFKEQFIYAKKYDSTRCENIIIDSTPVFHFNQVLNLNDSNFGIVKDGELKPRPQRENEWSSISLNANYIYLDSNKLKNKTIIKVNKGQTEYFKIR